MQIKKKKLFLFQLQICGSSSACRKKTRCRRMAPVPPFWDICQWQNFPRNLNTWPNTSTKRFFLLPFIQPKKNVQKSMLLHWCCPWSACETLWSAREIASVALWAEQERHTENVFHIVLSAQCVVLRNILLPKLQPSGSNSSENF